MYCTRKKLPGEPVDFAFITAFSRFTGSFGLGFPLLSKRIEAKDVILLRLRSFSQCMYCNDLWVNIYYQSPLSAGTNPPVTSPRRTLVGLPVVRVVLLLGC